MRKMEREREERSGTAGPLLVVSACLTLLLCVSGPAQTDEGGGGPYPSRETFLEQAFPDGVPEPALVWLTGERGDAVETILGHRPPSLRVRYWRSGERSAWILEEIGKEELITAGFVVEEGRILWTEVLAFRESRGWEIRFPAFEAQFEGLQLGEDRELTSHVDGISGATLSVRAMRKMARIALYLDRETGA